MARFSALFPYICTAALLSAAPAYAEAQLVRASPQAGSSTAALKEISLEFSESLAPASSFELVMTGMPGMEDHPPMPIRGFSIVVQDKNMHTLLPRALPAGNYELTWRAVSVDSKMSQGTLRFDAE